MVFRPSRMEISLGNLARNYRAIENHVGPGVQLMPVIKADAYGHGMLEVARRLVKEGAQRFAVASSDEAFRLREGGVGEALLVMGPTLSHEAGELVRREVAVALTDMAMARALSKAALREGRAALIHVKVDTGMGRIGFLPEEVPAMLDELSTLPGMRLEGLFTHFAASDERQLEYTEAQFRRYVQVLEYLESRGFRVPLRHVCNSAGTLNAPEKHLDACRPGIVLYGMWPSGDCPRPVDLSPTFQIKTTVVALRTLPKGSGVGYGLRYVTPGQRRIAVLPMGYSDGLSRAFSMKMNVLIGGVRVRQIGNICMDQTMVDVTGLGVSIGDEVVLVGRQGDLEITPDDLAAARENTLNYEIPVMFGQGLPRVYLDD